MDGPRAGRCLSGRPLFALAENAIKPFRKLGTLRSVIWRKATEADVPLLADLNRQLSEDDGTAALRPRVNFEERLRARLGGRYTAVLFELDDTPIGYALWRDNEGRGIYLRQFFILRDRRRQGLGRRAFELLTREILPPDTDITLEVGEQNPAGLAFWQGLGFVVFAKAMFRAGSK